MTLRCPLEDQELFALLTGELAERRARDVRDHTEACSRCAASVRKLSLLLADLRSPVDGALGNTPDAFADGVLAHLDEPRAPTVKRPGWRWLAVAAAAVPIGLAALQLAGVQLAGVQLAAGPRTPEQEWSARGGTIAGRSDIRKTLVRFGTVQDDEFVPLLEGASLARHAVLLAEVGGTGDEIRWLLAFLVDANGERHWIYPSYEAGTPPPSAVPLPAVRAPRVLGTMVRMDDPAPGPGRLVAVVLPKPVSIDALERGPATDLTRARLSERYPDALVVSVPVHVRAD